MIIACSAIVSLPTILLASFERVTLCDSLIEARRSNNLAPSMMTHVILSLKVSVMVYSAVLKVSLSTLLSLVWWGATPPPTTPTPPYWPPLGRRLGRGARPLLSTVWGTKQGISGRANRGEACKARGDQLASRQRRRNTRGGAYEANRGSVGKLKEGETRLGPLRQQEIS